MMTEKETQNTNNVKFWTCVVPLCDFWKRIRQFLFHLKPNEKNEEARKIKKTEFIFLSLFVICLNMHETEHLY